MMKKAEVIASLNSQSDCIGLYQTLHVLSLHSHFYSTSSCQNKETEQFSQAAAYSCSLTKRANYYLKVKAD